MRKKREQHKNRDDVDLPCPRQKEGLEDQTRKSVTRAMLSLVSLLFSLWNGLGRLSPFKQHVVQDSDLRSGCNTFHSLSLSFSSSPLLQTQRCVSL